MLRVVPVNLSRFEKLHKWATESAKLATPVAEGSLPMTSGDRFPRSLRAARAPPPLARDVSLRYYYIKCYNTHCRH